MAYGFIGKSICETLVLNDKTVIGLVRNLELSKNINKVTYVPVGDIGLKKNLKDTLVGTDCVIHCAGKIPDTNKIENDQIKAYHLANFEVTKQIAEQAVDAGGILLKFNHAFTFCISPSSRLKCRISAPEMGKEWTGGNESTVVRISLFVLEGRMSG